MSKLPQFLLGKPRRNSDEESIYTESVSHSHIDRHSQNGGKSRTSNSYLIDNVIADEAEEFSIHYGAFAQKEYNDISTVNT